MEADYDLCIIGGGINGAGIAREAAGRGLSVLLVEAQDLAQGTSSASTKLVHGGLRYLEQGELRLVRESLQEREALLKIAPHIVEPMEFVLPHVVGLRPRWMVGLGLFLYDHLSGRRKISKSGAVSLRDSFLGEPLKDDYTDGFKYSDCRVDDSRLVVLNVMDAKARGAEILTRTACVQMTPSVDAKRWYMQLKDLRIGDEFQISARMVVNAGGPWVRGLLETSDLVREDTPGIRLVKGSHLIVPRLYEGDHAYLLQQPDKRVVFAIPYEKTFTLIGTTDEPFEGDAMTPVISAAERDYLCAAVNRFFDVQITPDNAPWTFSGVRALYDNGEDSAQNITRDYHLDLNESHGVPMLSVFGGKLTTYRVLAERVVSKITASGKNAGWTKKTPLPGGDIEGGNFAAFLQKQLSRYKFLPADLVERYARLYGTRMVVMLENVTQIKAMGRDFGGGLYEVEVQYLIDHEFAMSAEDILWRRTKLGLHLEKRSMLALESAMPDYLKEKKAA